MQTNRSKDLIDVEEKKMRLVISEQVKHLRMANGETQADLAELIGIPRQYVVYIEGGTRRNVPVFMIFRMARHWGVPMELICSGQTSDIEKMN